MSQLMKAWPHAAKTMSLDHKSKGVRLEWGNRILVPKYRETPAASWTELTMQQGAILRSILHRTIMKAEGCRPLQGCLFN
jgi:hypothetical protein